MAYRRSHTCYSAKIRIVMITLASVHPCTLSIGPAWCDIGAMALLGLRVRLYQLLISDSSTPYAVDLQKRHPARLI